MHYILELLRTRNGGSYMVLQDRFVIPHDELRPRWMLQLWCLLELLFLIGTCRGDVGGFGA